MTTNAPDKLDPALIRAGRCDHRVLFGYVSPEISTRIFTHCYTKRPEELVDAESSGSEHYDIPSVAQAFASAIPKDSMISPAEVQGYLMKHCHDPQAAVEGAEEFARHIIEIKAQGKNVAAFANELRALELDAESVEDSKSVEDPVRDHSNESSSGQGGERERDHGE